MTEDKVAGSKTDVGIFGAVHGIRKNYHRADAPEIRDGIFIYIAFDDDGAVDNKHGYKDDTEDYSYYRERYTGGRFFGIF